jgi:hypothetical protein
MLAHALEPYLPQPANGASSQSLQAAGLGAAVKGISQLL